MTAPLSAEQLAVIKARHAIVDARYPSRDPDARDAHEDRATLLAHVDHLTAELARVRADRLALARHAVHVADPTGETLPDLTYGEAREAIGLARRIVAEESDR